jgi:DNA polymerase/3'-5' exonuclease PolX
VAQPSEVTDGLFGEPRYAIQEVRQIAEGMGPIEKGGERYIQVRDIYGSGNTLDLFLVHPPSEWGVQLAIRTGPASYSMEAVSRIRGRLWKCKDGWIRDERGQRVPCPDEKSFFAAAQMEWIPPEERG